MTHSAYIARSMAVETTASDGTRPARPYTALCCALVHMRQRCEQLNDALASRNAAIAESLVQDCVQYWLVAAAALRRLDPSKEHLDVYTTTASQAVSRTAQQLLALLDRGADVLPEPTSAGFAHLRLSVTLAVTALERRGDRRDRREDQLP